MGIESIHLRKVTLQWSVAFLAASGGGSVAARPWGPAAGPDASVPLAPWPGPPQMPAPERANTPMNRPQALRQPAWTDVDLRGAGEFRPVQGNYFFEDTDLRIMPEIQLRLPALTWSREDGWNVLAYNETLHTVVYRNTNVSALLPNQQLHLGDAASFADLGEPTVTLRAELWGQLYWPRDDGGRAPLAVLAHGYHEVCADVYDTDETICALYATREAHCVPSPNHLGYAYLAERLSQRGFVVLSINTNAVACRGKGSDLANEKQSRWSRGKAVLENLALLRRWDGGEQAPASVHWPRTKRIDFGDVHLMGHSRSGEGARAALALARNGTGPMGLAGLTIRSIFEIAPAEVDWEHFLTANGIPWATLLPACDGDVTTLEGMEVFDRAMQAHFPDDTEMKATLLVHGGRHNNLNTVWGKVHEAGQCLDDWETTAGDEREILTESVMALFGSYARGGDPRQAVQFFDPLYELPAHLRNMTRIDRNYVRGASQTQSLFLAPLSDTSSELSVTHGPLDVRPGATHDSENGTVLVMQQAHEAHYVYLWSPSGQGVQTDNWVSLNFRIGRYNLSDGSPSWVPQTLSLQLVGSDDSLSRGLMLNNQTCPVGPVRMAVHIYHSDTTVEHFIMQTSSILLDDIADRPARARGVRLTISGPRATLGLGEVWASKTG